MGNSLKEEVFLFKQPKILPFKPTYVEEFYIADSVLAYHCCSSLIYEGRKIVRSYIRRLLFTADH